MKQEFIDSISRDGTFIENPRNVLIGKYRGYLMVLYKINRNLYEININASRDARSLNEMLSFLYKEIGSDKRVKECVYENCKIIITFKRKKDLSEQITEMADKIVDYLQSHRLNTGCALCGTMKGINAYSMKKNVQFLCGDCYERCYEFIFNKKMKHSKANKHILDLNINYAEKSNNNENDSKVLDKDVKKKDKKKSSKKPEKEIIQTSLGTGYMYSDASLPKKDRKSLKKDEKKARIEKELLKREEEERKELLKRQAEEKKKKEKKEKREKRVRKEKTEKVRNRPIVMDRIKKKERKEISSSLVADAYENFDMMDSTPQIDNRSPMMIFSTNSLAAFLGCLIGVAVWVMAYEIQARFDSVDGVLEIAMLAIPAFALTFYSKYSKDQIEIKSMVMSVILIFAMVYFAYNLVVALSIRELSISMGKDVSIINAFTGVRNFMATHPENKDLYYKKMIGSYIWTIIVTAMMIYIIDYNSKRDIA